MNGNWPQHSACPGTWRSWLTCASATWTEFPPAPELAISGWARQRPLAWAVHDGRWGQRGLPGAGPASLLADTLAAIRPADAGAITQARERQERLTKPSGSLGALEDLSVRLAGLTGACPPPLPEPGVVAVFAADHGVHAQGVTPWPQEVTAQMVANFLASGAVVNAIAAQTGAEVCVVDVGVAADLPPAPGLLPRKVRPGTADMTAGPAMSLDEAQRAVEVGIETARDLVAAGNRCLVTGDMGIANTTASAALIAVFTGAEAQEVTGRGTGIDDETWERKVSAVRRALARHQPDPAQPLAALAAVGGLEHAALAGFMLGGAALAGAGGARRRHRLRGGAGGPRAGPRRGGLPDSGAHVDRAGSPPGADRAGPAAPARPGHAPG